MSDSIRLTEDQEKILEHYADTWNGYGLCTDPAKRDAAERSICLAYQEMGKEIPKVILWTDGPLEATILHNFFNFLETAHDHDYKGRISFPNAQKFKEKIISTIQKFYEHTKNMYSKIDQKKNELGYLQNNPQEKVLDCFLDFVNKDNYPTLYTPPFIYGQHDANFLCFYEFLKDNIPEVNDKIEPLNGLINYGKNSGWAIPYEEVAICAERHDRIKFDDSHRPHSLDGPAISYPEGYQIYALNGIRVPRKLVMDPQSITAQEVIEEDNQEVRSLMLEQMGMDKFLKDVEAEVVDSDPEYGTLYKFEFQDPSNMSEWQRIGNQIRVVQVKNSTPEPDGTCKDYFLMIPPDDIQPEIKTAQQAVAWTFGFTNVRAKQYNPDQET